MSRCTMARIIIFIRNKILKNKERKKPRTGDGNIGSEGRQGRIFNVIFKNIFADEQHDCANSVYI